MDEEERLGLGRRNQGHDPCHSAVLPKISLLQTPPEIHAVQGRVDSRVDFLVEEAKVNRLE